MTGGTSPATSGPSVSSSGALKSDALFSKIQEEVKKNPDKAKAVGGVFLYNITDSGKTVKQWSKYIHIIYLNIFLN